MQGKYSEPFAVNSRVTIDYKKKKVRFSYPDEDKRIDLGLISAPFLLIWILTNLIAFFLILIYLFILYLLYVPIPIFQTDFSKLLFYFGILILCIVYSVGIPLTYSIFVKKNYKYYQKIFPKLNADILGFFKRFKDKNKVEIRKLKEPYYEIPLFMNIVLEYKASRQFSDFLEKVEIKEHPFKQIEDGKSYPNTDLWKAKFIFSQIPKTGSLKIFFI